MTNEEHTNAARDLFVNECITHADAVPFDRGYANLTRYPLIAKAARACVQCVLRYHDVYRQLTALDGFDRILLVMRWSDYIEAHPTDEAVKLILDSAFKEDGYFCLSESITADAREETALILGRIIDAVGKPTTTDDPSIA